MTRTTDGTPGRHVKSVQTACDVLDALRRLDGAGVTELADHLGVSKATVHGHLSTLYENELVVRSGDEYDVGLRFVDFGEYAKHSVPIYEVACEEVDRLAEQTGEVAQVMVEEHGKGVYLHKAVGENGVHTAAYPGARKYLHCTALGKAILAHLPEERVDEIVDRHGLPGKTEATITDRATLDAELEEIRERGVAVDDEEILQGLRCIGAPLTGHDGELYGAISVSGPTSRFKGERFESELPETVRGVANVIQINATQV
jgi:DNA-binding IclR family transcriptional regulator